MPTQTRSASTISSAGWTNYNNVAASDDARATYARTTNGHSPTIDLTNFGFSLPGDAVITDIKVDVEGHASHNSGGKEVNWTRAQLLKAGSPTGQEYSDGTIWGLSDAIQTVQHNVQGWHAFDLLFSDVNASNFGVRLRVQFVTDGTSVEARIDHVQVTITYEIPGQVSSGPGTVTSNAPGDTAWANPSNAGASDDSYASVTRTSNGDSEELHLTNLGFGIPAGATIDGIRVIYETKASHSEAANKVVISESRIIKGGSVGSQNKGLGQQFSTGTFPFKFGSNADLWDETFDPDDINASNFGCMIKVSITSDGSSVVGQIDFVRVEVYYTGGGGGGAGGAAILAQRILRPALLIAAPAFELARGMAL